MSKSINRESILYRAIFPVVFVAALIVLGVLFNLITNGRFLDGDNIKVIISHTIYPIFIAWGLCFLFASGYTDMSVGGVVVLGSFAAGALGNKWGYPGLILGGVAVGTLLIFINFNIFAFTKIPSWIAGISLAMVYEAIAVFLKFNPTTKPYVTQTLNKEYRILWQLPWSLILVGIGLVVVHFIYNRTSVGLNIRSIGGNEAVSKKLGINITKTLLKVGLIVGILIGVAAVLQESYSGITTVKTGLTSMAMIFQPLAIFLLAQILQKRINIIIAVPICSFIVYSVFNILTIMKVPSGTLQEAFLGLFLIAFGIIGQRGAKGVVK